MENTKNGKPNVFTNVMWRMLERIGAQGVNFVVTLIAARKLPADAYGTVALMNVFITISSVILESGFSSALIQKEDADDLDFSSVFYFQLGIGVLIYAVLFTIAPLVAEWYQIPELTALFRAQTIIILISSVRSIQGAYVSRKMMFKKFFFATLGGTIGAAVIGITLIYKGYGVWAMVIQYLFNNLVDTIILWIMVKWRPKKCFSFTRLKSLFSYGWKLLAAGLIDTLYYEVRQLVIGLKYSTADLAYFNRGENFPSFVLRIINTSLSSVIFPAMAREQKSKENIKEISKRTIRFGCYLLFPALIGLASCAEEVITILVTEKYLPSVPYLQIYAFVYSFYPVKAAILSAYNAIGRSDLYLKRGIINDVICLVILAISLRFGVLAIALSMILTNMISLFVNAANSKQLFNYGIWEQLKDVFPSMAMSGAMWGMIWMADYFILAPANLSVWFVLIIKICLGVVLYFSFSIVFRNKEFFVLFNAVRQGLFKRRKQNA